MVNHFLVGRRCLAAACVLLVGMGLARADQMLEFDDAWIRALPPGMGMTAGFGTLRNTGDETVEISGFSSPDFADVSLHRTETVDGVSRMREIPTLSIAPGEAVELAPGGYHLMLMKPIVPVAAGQQVTVYMSPDGGQQFRFEVNVERR